MAVDKKPSELVELLKAGVSEDDLFVVVNAGESKKLKKSTIFSLITDMITAAVDAFKVSFGVLVLVAATSIENTLQTAFNKIEIVNSLGFDKSNGHVAYDFVNFNATIATDGIYELAIFGSFTAPNNSDITFSTYKNGAIISPLAQVVFTGAGTKPVALSGGIITELLAGDVLDVRAKSSNAADLLTLLTVQYKIEKTHF